MHDMGGMRRRESKERDNPEAARTKRMPSRHLTPSHHARIHPGPSHPPASTRSRQGSGCITPSGVQDYHEMHHATHNHHHAPITSFPCRVPQQLTHTPGDNDGSCWHQTLKKRSFCTGSKTSYQQSQAFLESKGRKCPYQRPKDTTAQASRNRYPSMFAEAICI